MMYWLIAIISAYLFFALAALGDKLVLAGKVNKAKPRAYTFYVGVFSLLVLLLIPFTGLSMPSSTLLIWIALDAFIHILGLYSMYIALENFEVSKVVSTIGATQPIFIFILTWIFWGPQAMSVVDVFAFIILLLASTLISIEKDIKITKDYLKITLFSSLMFALDYVFSKFVFLGLPFIQGIIWIRIFVFLFVLFLLLSEKSRKEIFSKQVILSKKNQTIFVYAQAFGGLANFLQSLAISLTPVIFLATLNSLRGIQYAFLFLIALFMARFFPNVLKENLSRKIIIQKVVSIALIILGLGLLTS